MGNAKGGMEKVSKDLYHALSGSATVRLITVSDCISRNPLSILVLFFKVFLYILFNKKDGNKNIIYLQDCALAPLLILKKFFNVPAVIQAHGLDVVYCNWMYQHIIVPLIRLSDIVICVSEATRQECISRGISKERTVVIPNGISPCEWDNVLYDNDSNVSEKTKQILSGRYLLSVGRLIKRKGFDWFISDVFPQLAYEYPDIRYFIIGEGPMMEELKELVKKKELTARVFLLGKVDSATLAYAYSRASIMISPNRKVHCDIEGFGVVNIEASLFGVPVVAARIDGIPDSISEGITGILVQPEDVREWVSSINFMLNNYSCWDRNRIRSETIDRYGWDRIVKRYISVFESIYRSKEVH